VLIGVPKETKVHEHRVGMTPAGARALTARGHRVIVESTAGDGSAISDEAYRLAGATIVPTATEAWASDLVVKVKEPLPAEYHHIHDGLLLYTFLHLAAEPDLTRELVAKKVTGVAYETIQSPDGTLPLLRPMSEIAGRMAVQVGASCLEKGHGGKGVLLGGVPGTRRGRVVILGAGVVGRNAATIAVGMGAHVTVLDVRAEAMGILDERFGGAVQTLHANAETIETLVRSADLVIGAVLIPGTRAPRLVSDTLVAQMERGSVIVDVAVDQGGCVGTCRPTTHDNPTFEMYGVVHYCVSNMPGAVSHTSTWALTNATLQHAVDLADLGIRAAARADSALARGINTFDGHVTYASVAAAHGVEYVPLERLLPA
jgi:alanine dehydrogenase